MDPKSRLDYALFQLTPTRTRCDLVICAGDCKEKLASGLLEPFIAHLKFAKDHISKGGYSVTLSAPASASWFTKSTIERFVRFVSTPEVLERFITIEREIENIDCSVNTNPSSDLQNLYGLESLDEQSNMSTGPAYKHEGNTSDAVHEEDSKIQLQRVLETRKAVLQGEQAMVYARALVAGFETENLHDLICFADAFGSPRLREACLSFIELCNTKSNDRVWMDEVAAMQAYSHSQYSYMDNVQNGTFTTKKQNHSLDSITTDSSISHGSHLPQYYQGNPLFQTPYYHSNLPWPLNAEASRSREKRSLKKESRELTMDGDSDSSDSTSRKAVIKNINYITSLREGKSEHESVDYISSKDAVNQDLDRTVEHKHEGQNVIKQWDIFQNLLMKDADDKDKLSDSQLRTKDILTVSESNPNQKKVEVICFDAPNDLYMVLGRDTAGQQAVPAWTPEMESGNSNKIVKLDSVEVKKSRTKGSVEKDLERKGSKIEAKSKALVGPLKNSKSDIVSRSKNSTATKTTIRKGKLDKEEEKRKKTEELLTQRQKRIAERSAYTATSAKTDKPKSQLTSRDLKKSNPVTRVLNPRVRPTESKPSNKPIKVTAKQNDEPNHATKTIKVIMSSTIDRLSVARVLNPKVQPTESKASNKPIKLTAKRNREPNPATKPTKVTTKEPGGSRTLLSKQTAGVDKNIGLKNSNGPKNKIVDHNNAKQLPKASQIKKTANVVAQSGTLHKGSSVLREDINGRSANKAINSVSFSFDKVINGVKENTIAKTKGEIAPPPGNGSPERSSSRKKWSSLSGFRKLLSFGRRS